MDQYSLEDSQDRIKLRAAFERATRRLETRVPAAHMTRFIRPLRPLGLQGSVARFAAQGRFVADWVKSRYLDDLGRLLSDELGRNVTVEIEAEPRDLASNRKPEDAPAIAPAVSDADEGTLILDDRYTFDTFVQGQSNRLAYAGAVAVANAPGTKYNPLFIYGASGLGKTHLLHSIARQIREQSPDMPIRYASAQQFVEGFVAAVQRGRTEQFRRSHRTLAVWLLDDVQFIAGKDKTQEEVFHLFNSFQQAGKQIVLASDRPPRDLYLMDERLRSRFEAGLVADIQHPDTETRCAIVRSKAQRDGIALPQDVAMYLAENVPGNIRTLEGALTKLSAQASLDGAAICMDIVRQIVARDFKDFGKPGLEQIVKAVSEHFKISVNDILGQSRKAPIAHARHVSVYVTRELTGDSWKHIGRQFGNRDHTSVMHSYQRITEMVRQDRELKVSIQRIIEQLHPQS